MNDVLYCGDATLASGACYLGGVMTHLGIGFDYVPMNEAFPSSHLQGGHRLILLSDYPSGNFSGADQDRILELVEAGTSLLMVGGWESFHGLIGGYQSSTLARMLPVECLDRDDRLNWAQGLVPVVRSQHAVLGNLPWDRPPVVCGCNIVKTMPGSVEVLSLHRLHIEGESTRLDDASVPLLVMGAFGRGKTGAFTTDFAPHWVGGLVDWGEVRVKAEAPGGRAVEVGDYYVQFVSSLLRHFLAG